MLAKLALLCSLFIASQCAPQDTPASSGPSDSSGPPTSQGTMHRRSYFYIGGSYTQDGTSTLQTGQMYVEHLVPAQVTKPLPLVMVHGLGQTGTNFLNTPDGRPGWADFFLSQGYEVYIVDQPARGRSPWVEGIDGPEAPGNAVLTEQIFTATQNFNLWPQAKLHTQWPGSGLIGDPIFDAFAATQAVSLTSAVETDNKVKNAGVQLIDKIGNCILLTHSQAGQFGWILGDARPTKVKAILAIEPNGPPFISAVLAPVGIATRAYGLTDIPITYSPAITDPSQLKPVVVSTSPNVTCFQQAAPARKLANIMQIPVLMVTSESSFHAPYDSCTANYLKQAGVAVDFVFLPDVGIHGNGHMMFMEKNSQQIAQQVVLPWLSKKKF